MRTSLRALLLFSFLASCAPAQIPETKHVDTSAPIVLGESFQFASKAMEGKREINVYLPAGYADEKNLRMYPVLYVLDGGRDQDFPHIAGLSQLASINGVYEELIVVGIKTENRMMELAHEPKDPRYIKTPAEAGNSHVFLRHIAEEVIPMIEKTYRVSERRAVVGESLAGLFVAEVFLKHPKTFTDYICVSPSLWWDDQRLAKSASELLKKHGTQRRQLYLTMADEGGTMQAGLDKLMEAIAGNTPTGLTWSYADKRKTERHATIYHGAVYDALRTLFEIPHEPNNETPWYLIEGAQPPLELTPTDKEQLIEGAQPPLEVTPTDNE